MGENPSKFKRADRPVEKVSWFDAVRFCNRLSEREGLRPAYRINGEDVSSDWGADGYRLPTEAEWEFAARAGTDLKYAGSDNLDEVGWYDENSDDETHPVGAKKANAWNLHDMSGNVWEWCWDWTGDYSSGTATDPRCPSSGSIRVCRGGSWFYDAGNARVAYRFGRFPGFRRDYNGFRLSRSAF
jgi:formylglycine-generating enzyme